MQDLNLNRRDALACLPALFALPAALAQGAGAPPPAQGGPPATPSVRAKGAQGSQEGFTMPFAIAACWADDLGALQDLRLRSRLDCSIGVACAKQPANDDESCAFLLSTGAAIECMAMLAAASMAGWGIIYQGAKGTDDLAEVYVKLGQVRKPPDAAAVLSAVGIFARPDPRGAFDPAATVPADCLEKVRVALIEQNTTAAVVKPERRDSFLKAVATLSKASPAFAAAVGPLELWKDGCTPVVMGRGGASNMQSAIAAGRCMQRAALFAHQFGASVDCRVVLPGVFEAAAASSAEAGAAARDLAMLTEAGGTEPLALVRVGKVLRPQARAAPLAMRILEQSVAVAPAAPDKPA